MLLISRTLEYAYIPPAIQTEELSLISQTLNSTSHSLKFAPPPLFAVLLTIFTELNSVFVVCQHIIPPPLPTAILLEILSPPKLTFETPPIQTPPPA